MHNDNAGLIDPTYAETVSTLRTADIIRLTMAHAITCKCDKCLTLWREIERRG